MAPSAILRLRKTGVRALAFAGGVAIETSRKLAASDGEPDLQGDRWVEWSFCLARLGEGPGTTLDFGAGMGFLSLAAAQRGYEVVALDRLSSEAEFRHDRVTFLQGDILERPMEYAGFDQIINCSSIEHVGLAGRYGSTNAPDGDLEAMTILRRLLSPGGRMVMTVPVGRDVVFPPFHRVYGNERLPRLLQGFSVEEKQFWQKDRGTLTWVQTDCETALAVAGSSSFYALGLFVLARA